ncbi:MAG: regulatory subunit of cyclin-dependent kinase [Benjaminiella poitrasii]|nr:MAG: regulatory subunit of cyclin-dependent kinase [Benjaminiella poitrasii]
MMNKEDPTAEKRSNVQERGGITAREQANLMPKTINELKELQAKGRKLLIKRKYIKKQRYNNALAPRIKTDEEIKAEKLQREKDIRELSPQIIYSKYYYDKNHEYRHVVLPENLARWLPRPLRLLKAEEWIELGVYQSSGWEHYMIHAPEPHILLFKREKDYLNKYGDHNPQYPPEVIEARKQKVKEIQEKKRLEQLQKQQEQEQKQEQQQQMEVEESTEATNISDIPPTNTLNYKRIN